MSGSATQYSQDAPAVERSPLERLLHGLNQPLTGLQCSMEVALASPRAVEYYVQGLRDGLTLTERMRALVEAIREVVDAGAETNEGPEAIEWKTLLREVVDDLKPVAEVKGIRITLDCSTVSSLSARGVRRKLSNLFRLLESALSLADRGSGLRIETGIERGSGAEAVWVRVRWYAGLAGSEFSRPELGLLVARAGWERAGAKWERERAENLESVTVRLPGVSEGSGNS